MILAAGRGARLKPLTDSMPKPLVQVKNKPLIVYHLEKLAKMNISEVVINVWHLGYKIKQYLGNGSAWGLHIVYSEEEILLETGGGICKALPLLGDQDFILINGDVFTQYDFGQLLAINLATKKLLGHLVLVPNPNYKLVGDYGVDTEGFATQIPTYTYAGLAKLSPNLFKTESVRKFRLPELFVETMPQKKIGAELYQGFWYDVGTIERLKELESSII